MALDRGMPGARKGHCGCVGRVPMPHRMQLRRFFTAIGALSILLGLVVLLGWVLGSDLLMGIGQAPTRMKANTALSVCALGAAVLLRRFGAPRAAAGVGLIVLAIGGATVVEYLARLGHGFDELVFVDPNRVQAGRMGINTALAFFLLGTALLLLRGGQRRATLVGQGCAIGALTIAFLALMGYANGIKALYGPASYTAMALSTALALGAISLAVLMSSAAYGAPAIALARTPGGRMARHLLPLAGMPIVLQALGSRAADAGLWSDNVSSWLVWTVVVAVCVLAVLLVARAVDRTEATRALLSTLVEASSEAIVTTDAERVGNGGQHALRQDGRVHQLGDRLAHLPKGMIELGFVT